MLWVLLILTFIAIVALTLAKDSFLNRQFYVYRKIATYPYLNREFIQNTYSQFD